MRKRKNVLAILGATVATLALLVGCAQAGSGATDAGKEPAAPSTSASATAAGADTNSMEDWIAAWPAQYYSFMDGKDDMDDMGGYIDKTGGTHSHANLYQNFMIRFTPDWQSIGSGLFTKSTCIACKGGKFNQWFEEDGYDVIYDRYNEKYTADTVEQDVWSCNTCHSDISDPQGTVGAQLVTFELFGKSLANEVDPGTAVCAQCHNALGTYVNYRSIDGVDLETQEVDAYKFGTDPEGFVQGLKEQTTDSGTENPEGKKWVDKELGIYAWDLTHPDVELYVGGNHDSLGLECADCHMSTIRTNMGGGYTKEDYETGQYTTNNRTDSGTTYTSHDASGSPLDSYSAMNMCLDCHKAQGVESAEEMVAYVHAAQDRFAERYAEVVATGDECLTALKEAISGNTKDAATLDKAREDFAMARTYAMFANGAPEKPGEKIVHNPDASFEYCDRAEALYEDIMKALA